MLAVASQSSDGKSWVEGDEGRVPPLIAKAERAIVERARQLFNAGGDNTQEGEALNDALYALHALKTCLEIHGKFADAA